MDPQADLRRLTTRAAATLLVAVLVGCTVLPGAGTVTVGVYGREGWEPSTDLVLQIDDRTFDGFGGLASAEVTGLVDVYVIERDTCESRIGFRADPGSRHLIRLGADDVEVRELVADEPMDAGPLLGAVPPLDCPAR